MARRETLHIAALCPKSWGKGVQALDQSKRKLKEEARISLLSVQNNPIPTSKTITGVKDGWVNIRMAVGGLQVTSFSQTLFSNKKLVAASGERIRVSESGTWET